MNVKIENCSNEFNDRYNATHKIKSNNMKTKKHNFEIKRNRLLFILISLFAILFISCDGGGDDNNDSSNPTSDKAGEAKITLTAGGQEFKVFGPCGWATALGTHYIGANQSDNNLRTFSSYFNISELPSSTTTYTLVEDSSDTDPTHITMNITEISGSKLTEWSSKNTSGKLILVVEGSKITANLAGITLYPQTNSGAFTNGNVGAFANNGILTGTLTFYKK